MRTKEEILDRYLNGFNWVHWSKDNAQKAMQEYADEQSIAFGEWMHLNCLRQPNNVYSYNCLNYTITELLQIFKNENK